MSEVGAGFGFPATFPGVVSLQQRVESWGEGLASGWGGKGESMGNGAAQLPSESTVNEKRKNKTEIIAAGRGGGRETSLEEYTGDAQKNTERDLSVWSFL